MHASPRTVKQIAHVQDVEAYLQDMGGFPQVDMHVLHQMLIKPVIPGKVSAVSFGIFSFAFFEIRILVNKRPESFALFFCAEDPVAGFVFLKMKTVEFGSIRWYIIEQILCYAVIVHIVAELVV